MTSFDLRTDEAPQTPQNTSREKNCLMSESGSI